MTLSIRSQTCTIYTPATVNDGGYASVTYSTTGNEYFCRVVDQTARERMATGQDANATAATLELSDEVTVPTNSLFRVNGLTYRIAGVRRRPLCRTREYRVEWLDQAYPGVPA